MNEPDRAAHEALFTPPDRRSELHQWLTLAAGAGAGVLAALGILLTIPLWHDFQYKPYGGVVGPPAFLNQSSAPEMLAYLAGVPLAAMLGWAGARLALRLPGGLWFGAGACVIEFGFILLARRLDWIPRSRATALLGSIQHDPWALVQVAALGYLAVLLTLPPPPLSLPRPTLRGPLLRVIPPGDAVFNWLSCHLPVFLMLSVFFGAAMPSLLIGLAAAIPFTYLLVVSLGCPEFPRKAGHVTVWLELAGWFALAIAPFWLWYLRLRLTFEMGVPSPIKKTMIAGAIALIPALMGWLRRRQGCAPRFDPVWLLPFALFGMFTLAAGASSGYDPFHQGEFTYPAQALRRGLAAWRDVFIVHGLGANTLPGLLMGAPSPANHSLDLMAVNILADLTVALELVFLLRLWGRPWWMLALVLAFFTGVAGGPPTFRYLPMWIVLLLVLEFVRARRLKWLALAGCAAWLTLLYSLDVGALLLVACGFWSIIWGLAFGRGSVDRRRSQITLMGRTYPAIAFGFGVAAAAIPTLLILWGGGLLREFWDLHLEYLRVKHHYDKIPFALDFLTSIVSPGASVLGLWTVAGIVRRRESGPLAGAILLLLILNLLAFARAMDRSDSGHIAYASLPAWPLLGCLLVWQARGRSQHWPESRPTLPTVPAVTPLAIMGRSVLAGALLMVVPYCRPLINNPGGLVIPGQPVWALVLPISYAARLFAENVRLPFTRPVDDPVAVPFFRSVQAMRGIMDVPGPWSLQTERRLYDFSNQPAIYTWTGLTAPTRFFTAYYAAGERWQEEVVGELERQRTPWILWRGTTDWANIPDGMPNYLRQWKIAEYILAHYIPAHRIDGDAGNLDDAASTETFSGRTGLILKLGDDPIEMATADQPHAPLWLHSVHLNELPVVFGKNASGVPSAPMRVLMHADLERDKEGAYWLTIAESLLLKSATELQVTITPPVEGRVEFMWQTASDDRLHRTVSFNAHADFSGPYRVRLANLPIWVWGGAPIRVFFQLSESDFTPAIRAEWLGDDHAF